MTIGAVTGSSRRQVELISKQSSPVAVIAIPVPVPKED
jgi:hypothetical protein